MKKAMIGEWLEHPYSTAGRRIFAIGDVHGMRIPMEAVLDTMRELAGEGGPDGADLVWLGDVIDRGPDSAACLQAYLADDPAFARTVRLCGNHEKMMLLGLGFSPKHRPGLFNFTEIYCLDLWLDNGGRAAVRELIEAADLSMPDTNDVEELRDRVAEALRALGVDLPRRFYEGDGAHYRAGDLIFVHAGINPLFDQKRFLDQRWWAYPKRDENDHWAWVRAPFLRAENPGGEGGLVVHGHTPEPSAIRNFSDLDIPVPEDFGNPDQVEKYLAAGGHRIRDGKLNLDGGSSWSRMVVGAQIEDRRYRIIWARKEA
ncbi:metallophosphoesterase [Nisaea sp.]|uniref:metallophosphoesterase n=1 Tax=Nisaea sp. TaxID=2024842 RepID=UPI002B278C44|nr:metallophosphoesterase [Nisaea sp.]